MNILCMGDSLTYGMGVPRFKTWVRLAADLSGHSAVNGGLSGDTTGGMLVRLHRELAENSYNAVMVMGGVNDFIAGGTPEQAAANCMAMGALIAGRGGLPLFCLPLESDAATLAPEWGPPEEFTRINALLPAYRDRLARVAGIYGGELLDMNSEFSRAAGADRPSLFLDGLHLNDRGHALFAEIVTRHWGRLGKF